MSGEVDKSTSSMSLSASPHAVKRHGGHVVLQGAIYGASSDSTVYVYRRYLGTTTTQLAATLTATSDGSNAFFTWRSGVLHKAAVFTASWDGDADALGASASVLVSVKKH